MILCALCKKEIDGRGVDVPKNNKCVAKVCDKCANKIISESWGRGGVGPDYGYNTLLNLLKEQETLGE